MDEYPYELKHDYTMKVLDDIGYKGHRLRIYMDGAVLCEISLVEIMWHRIVIERLKQFIWSFYPTNLKRKKIGEQLHTVQKIVCEQDALNRVVDRESRRIRRNELREKKLAEEDGFYD